MQTQTYRSNTQICHNTISIQRIFVTQSQKHIMCVKCKEVPTLSKGKSQNLIHFCKMEIRTWNNGCEKNP